MLPRALFLLLAVAIALWALRPVDVSDGPPEADRLFARIPPDVTWYPDKPGEGHLFELRLRTSIHSPIIGAHGTVAGEELHFHRTGEREWATLAAAPVGASDSIPVRLRLVYSDGAEARFGSWVAVEPGSYRHERLTVAPRFGAPPSEEDEVRMRRDREVARSVAERAHRTPRIPTDTVVLPRDSRVTSGFGDGREFNGRVSSRHMGLDLRGGHGDTVVAAARGVVALVDTFLLAGRLVYLSHGDGLVTGYFHLSRTLVEVGDTVGAGEPVGLVGATGRVTGPHLHWVARYGNTSVDPRTLLDVSLR